MILARDFLLGAFVGDGEVLIDFDVIEPSLTSIGKEHLDPYVSLRFGFALAFVVAGARGRCKGQTKQNAALIGLIYPIILLV